MKQYPNCLNSRASFKSVLMDKYPAEKQMVNILTTIYECGIANKIKAMDSITYNKICLFANQLERKYGIAETYSKLALEIWANAYDVKMNSLLFDLSPLCRKLTYSIYFIIDCGTHMIGDRIGAINITIEEIVTCYLPELIEVVTKCFDVDLDLRFQIIRYGSGASRIFPTPLSCQDIVWNDLEPFGNCDLGAAFNLLEEDIRNYYQEYKVAFIGALYPAVIVFSGSKCTDDYRTPISKIDKYKHLPRSSGIRIGVPIGDDADINALMTFTKFDNTILSPNNFNHVKKLIMQDIINSFYNYGGLKMFDMYFVHEDDAF